jgi:hypothetical protein
MGLTAPTFDFGHCQFEVVEVLSNVADRLLQP